MFIRSDVGTTHDHHHQHNLANDHSIAAATTTSTMVTKLNRDSHIIKKSSPSTSPPLTSKNRTHPRQPPLIIYAHAPRVIHTKPQEFKALVQTLTGYTGNKNSTVTTTATKNDLTSPSPPPPPPPTPLLPTSNKLPMYYDFEEFETKNVVPLIKNNLFSIHDDFKHKTSLMEENLNISGDGGGYNFAAPIFDPPLMHQGNRTSVPFFTPSIGDQFCCTNNNNSVGFVGKMNNNKNNNQMLYDQNYVGGETGSGCYYSDGLSSSLDLSSSLSSMEEPIDELTDFC